MKQNVVATSSNYT